MPSFKDLFSVQSSDYARFRPTYPPQLFEYLASVAPQRTLVWDAGTGNGQAALLLAEHFAKVLATDPSQKQIQSAPPHPRIEYQVAPAETNSLPDHSADLVTVAQAFHWFDQARFFEQVRRVLKPQGVVAFWCYGLAKITPPIDTVVLRLYEGVLGPYWEGERRLVEEGYRNVRVPFKELRPPSFEMTAEWSLDHLVGYLGTWSALQTYLKTHDSQDLEPLFAELKAAWGDAGTRTVRWELGLRVASV